MDKTKSEILLYKSNKVKELNSEFENNKKILKDEINNIKIHKSNIENEVNNLELTISELENKELSVFIDNKLPALSI